MPIYLPRKPFIFGAIFYNKMLFPAKNIFQKLDLQNGNFERPVNSIILYEQRGWIK